MAAPRKKPEDRVKVGRPSKYDPAFCEETIRLMAEGYSLGAVAGALGVARETIENWSKQHSEFLDAIKIGRAQAQLHWEKQLRRVAEVGGGPGTATAVIFGLKNRSPDDWRDKQEVEHSGGITVTISPDDAAL